MWILLQTYCFHVAHISIDMWIYAHLFGFSYPPLLSPCIRICFSRPHPPFSSIVSDPYLPDKYITVQQHTQISSSEPVTSPSNPSHPQRFHLKRNRRMRPPTLQLWTNSLFSLLHRYMETRQLLRSDSGKCTFGHAYIGVTGYQSKGTDY